jgi:hypothetical protein
MMRPFLCLALAAAWPALGAPAPAHGLPSTITVGVNVEGLADWNRARMFSDVMKTARRWGKPDQPWVHDPPIPVDANGWPTADAGVVVFAGVPEIEGAYHLTFKGTAKVKAHQPTIKVVNVSVDDPPGTTQADVLIPAGAGDCFLSFTETDRGVRDIRLLRPGCEKSGTFTPEFLDLIKPFPVLRYMELMYANGVHKTSWKERPKPTDASYAASHNGVPLEVLVELANLTKKSPWFCIPDQADEEYVRESAKLVKEKLDPAIPAYVEYSNEVWNGMFAQARYASDKAKELGLGSNPFEGQLRFYSQRTVEVMKAWSEVFNNPKRLVRVMAVQAVSTFTSRTCLDWQGAASSVDALAIAPYFGHKHGRADTADAVVALGPDGLLDRLAEEVDGENLKVIQDQAETARRYGLALVAYEGGQHLVGIGEGANHRKLQELFAAVNRHPRMEELYYRHLKHWFESGGSTYVIYEASAPYTKWGNWGLVEYAGQPLAEAPKLRGVLKFLKEFAGKPLAP